MVITNFSYSFLLKIKKKTSYVTVYTIVNCDDDTCQFSEQKLQNNHLHFLLKSMEKKLFFFYSVEGSNINI